MASNTSVAAIYKAGPSLRIRYDDQLMADLENMVGSGNVRLLGQHGATARLDSIAQPTPSLQPAAAIETEPDLDDESSDEMDDD